jgi:hypothetical protein
MTTQTKTKTLRAAHRSALSRRRDDPREQPEGSR